MNEADCTTVRKYLMQCSIFFNRNTMESEAIEGIRLSCLLQVEVSRVLIGQVMQSSCEGDGEVDMQTGWEYYVIGHIP